MPLKNYFEFIGEPITGGTSGSVLFIDSSNTIAQNNSNLFWNNTNDRLGIGTASPAQRLDVAYGNINLLRIPAPGACTGALAGAGAGNLTNGAYTYKVTFSTSVGQTEGGTVSNTVTVVDASTNGKISLTAIPTSAFGSNVTRKLYRTQSGGSTYTLLTSIADNTTTTFTDNTADANILNTAAMPVSDQSAGWIITGSQRVANFTSGGSSVILGANAGTSLTSGSNNVFVGQNAGNVTTSGANNVFIGNSSGLSNNVGTLNTFIGANSGQLNTSGSQNAFVGNLTGSANTTGTGNTFVGYQAGTLNTTASNNCFFGSLAGELNTTGSSNTGIGQGALVNNITGNSIAALGLNAGLSNVVSSSTTFLGTSSDIVNQPASTMSGTTVANAGSGLTAGLYKYRVTFVVGSETSAQITPFSITTVSAGNLLEVDLTGIPTYVGPLTCTARKIYRTVVNGAAYKLLTTIADNTTTIYNDVIADASLTTALSGPSNSIALGASTGFMFSNQFVVGSSGSPISNMFIGNGIYTASPQNIVIQGTGGSGSNIAGATVTIAGGQGTGTGASGNVIIQTAPVGSSGTAANALSTVGTFSPTGVAILGTTTNNDAATGYVGEYVSSTVLTGSAVNVPTTTATNITSISLTAGDWDVEGLIFFTCAAGTVGTLFETGINTTSATLPTDGIKIHSNITYPASSQQSFGTKNTRISINTTTTVYLVGLSVFTVSTMTAFGFIGARRAR